MIEIRICAVQFLIPGIGVSSDLKSFLKQEQPELSETTLSVPTSEFLPARQKRRMSRLTQMAVATTKSTRDIVNNPDTVPLIFGSANGEINTLQQILAGLVKPDRFISPTQFHNSVHNTAPGYWSILSGFRHPSTTVSAADGTFEYCLLEAWCRLQLQDDAVQITAADEKLPAIEWTDPSHCSFDMCGSLLLTTHDWQPCHGRLHQVRFMGRQVDRSSIVDTIREWKPAVIHTHCGMDLPGEVLPLPFPRNHSHPLATMYAFISLMCESPADGRRMLLTEARDGETFAVLFTPAGVAP